jgi:plasmid stabilization system protein ParE
VTRKALIFHPEAAHDAEEAQGWYRDRSLTAEEGFIADLNHAVEQVALAPLRWPRYKARTRRYVFRRYPYSLIYRIEGDLVRVLAVAHDNRRVKYWLSRAKTD